MWKAVDDSCFNIVVIRFMDLFLFRFANFLNLAYTLYTHGTNAKKTHDRVFLPSTR